MLASKHYRYFYKSEIPPKVILKKMIRTNIEDVYNTNEEPQKIDLNIERNRIYFSRRKELYNIIKSINNYISNSSQSLFLTLYFMDTIFTNEDLENIFFSHFDYLSYLSPLNDINMNNYVLLSLACLIITHKFNENDPKIPSTSSFAKLAYHFSNNTFSFSINDLTMAEVVAIKLLKYKLNYYTIYHFLTFFFTHGILFKTTLKNSKLHGKISEKKILEKIYIETREILDWIIESEEYYNYQYGKDNHLIVVESLLWSIEHVLGIQISDNENIFKLIFNININEDKHILMNEIIEKLYMEKKGAIESNSKPLFINKNNSKDTIIYDNPISMATLSQNRNNHYNMNSTQNINNKLGSSYNIYNALPTYDNSLTFINTLINNEIENLNTNYPYQLTVRNQQAETENNLTKIIGLKNRSFYGSNKNITSNYDINSIIPIDSAHIQNNSSNLDVISKVSKFEKEPTDNRKKRKPIDNNINIYEIDIDDIKGKKIYMNDGSRVKKKSLSCSKKPSNSMSGIVNYNNHLKSTFIDTSTINNINHNLKNEDELRYEEKINKPKVFDNKNKFNINKNLYSISPIKPFQPHNNNKKEKVTLFKKYQQSTNEHNSKTLNKNKIIPKTKIISSEELNNQTNNFYTVTKINQTVENEPRNNNKRSINKLKKSNGLHSIHNSNKKNNKLNKNKHNTIIINNNIQINTLYDNENKPVNTNREKKNSNFFVFNNYNENNENDLLTLPNYNNKYKTKNRQKLIYDLKNGHNLINKSTTLTSGYNFNTCFNFINQF